jgi:hypothetical protein
MRSQCKIIRKQDDIKQSSLRKVGSRGILAYELFNMFSKVVAALTGISASSPSFLPNEISNGTITGCLRSVACIGLVDGVFIREPLRPERLI